MRNRHIRNTFIMNKLVTNHLEFHRLFNFALDMCVVHALISLIHDIGMEYPRRLSPNSCINDYLTVDTKGSLTIVDIYLLVQRVLI